MNHSIVFFLVCLAAILIGTDCSKDGPLAGTEIRNGNCLGKIYTADGKVADNVIVRLIPSGYNPYSQSTAFIDSTYTDTHGDYAFMVSQPDYYNIVAEKGSTSCMQDSIFIQANAKTIADNDTLHESGTLSGIVRLKPGDDSRTAVILVLGSNVYTVPSDTSGRFSTPLLPKGDYVIQIFTTLSGYTVLDTIVTIREGTRTQLDVTLQSSNAPSIAKLSATYDSATMFVSLSWPMPDTSKIVSYALYRKSTARRDTMLYIDKGKTSYIDDVVGFDNDSVMYQIAGIGKNYKEGNRTVSQPIIVCGEVYCVKKIDLSRIANGLSTIGAVSVFSDNENEIFLVGYKGIFKLDSNGVVQKDYLLDNADTNFLNRYLQSDDAGHLYIQKGYDRHTAVIKFDRDLNVLAEPEIPCSTGYDKSIVVTGNGTIYQFALTIDSMQGTPVYCTDVKAYDSALAVIKEIRIMKNQIFGAYRLGETMVTHAYPMDQTSEDQPLFIHLYDTAFTLLSVVKPITVTNGDWGDSRFSGRINSDCHFIAAPNGIFVSAFSSLDEANGDSALLVFTDQNGKFLARIVLPLRGDWGNFSFDSCGNLYFVTYKYTIWDDVGLEMNPMTALFKYSIKKLLGKAGH
jgi:hypothetical protein